ncbi:Isocitrate/isopropylmalate dehydrogenase-domain-containing protein [Entophlyctis helioformis]|nr:Isocitrate/isopropylmalate dehydrogenase-domain-containing protein [Entophlyctis helioformis]
MITTSRSSQPATHTQPATPAPAPAQPRSVVVLPGDGIGPEVTAQAVRVLSAVLPPALLSIRSLPIGGAAIDSHGSPLPVETLEACRAASAILLGAVGGPQWPRPPSPAVPSPPRPEEGLLRLRKDLGLYANIRPCKFPARSLLPLSPLRQDLVRDTAFVMVRELTGGIYFGSRQEAADSPDGSTAFDTMTYSVDEIKRITRVAASIASAASPPLPITSIDKANVLATSRLWRRVVSETIAAEFPSVPLAHQLVDSAAMHMVMSPSKLNGVVLTENMFGDILSDEASVIPGSLGLLPSASLSGWGQHARGLYEPIHGSAPDIAGQNIANPIGAILSVAMLLEYSFGMPREARAVEEAVAHVLDVDMLRTRDLGGNASTTDIGDAVVNALVDKIRAIREKDVAAQVLVDAAGRLIPASLPFKRRPMTLCEKIICHSALGLPAPYHVSPGDMVCVSVDWTIASELTWKGMEKTFDEMGRPSIHRNDRFWLAIDHTVDPSINHQEKPKELIAASEQFAKEAKLTDFHGPNQTILHTEFYRERALPGQMIIGADSHSCSAGGLGNFAVGLGAADVVMPLVTGETWFKVPETVEIRFVGTPPKGIGGKDVILHVLGVLKRNTVAFERAVEWTGPGLKHLSCDARFAIANMTTEFGGIAGVFEGDEITAAYVAKRKDAKYRKGATYFRADPDAQYAESHIIDLGDVDSMVALYPSPDNVVHVDEFAGTDLDGVFIGACTTAEEDLILAALVLEQGLKRGWVPVLKGKRKVTPGSVSIVAKLRRLGLLQIYEAAGFQIGAPGCSYCLGIAADRAGEGEVWLSSQNRNFKNRMGKGSIGNLASAATVAASSFEMRARNPRDLIDAIDDARFQEMLEMWIEKGEPVTITEPAPVIARPGATTAAGAPAPASFKTLITGRVQRFEDHVDTDAIIPAEFMPGVSDEDLGSHCFQYTRPDFRAKVAQGFDIVVAGAGFGSGSSREEAPRALKGIGVQAVIARSYAYIYGRNQPNMALLGVMVRDDGFYERAQEGATVTIDLDSRTVAVDGATYPFELTRMEEKIIAGGGVTSLYKRYGRRLFQETIALAAEADTGAVPAAVTACGAATKKTVPSSSSTTACATGTADAVLSW